MGQSLVKAYYHIIFSTKGRAPLIHDTVAESLYEYLFGICRELECYPCRVGGYVDHVHVLCQLSKKVALVHLLETLKKNSSKWMKGKGSLFSNFYWQNGYGAFTVNPRDLRTVETYIINQAEHHRQKTYQDEYRTFLRNYEVQFDERYVWD